MRSRRLAWIPVALVVLAPLCVLASPYGTKLVDYYNLMLVDAPFAPILREWQWSSPSATTALFWFLALVGVAAPRIPSLPQQADGLRARRARRDVRRRGAGRAGRDLVRPRLRGDPSRRARRPPDESRTSTRRGSTAPISLASLAGLAVAILAFLAHSASWYVSDWHEQHIAAVREATRDPSTRVWATDGTADWLLWRIPELRGRIAYDVRFELYDQATLDRIVDYQARRGDWKSVAKGYRVVIVDDRAHLLGFRTEPDAKVVYRDNEIAIVARR